MNPIRTSLYIAMAIACCLLLSAMSKAQTTAASLPDSQVEDRSVGPFLRQIKPAPTRLGLARDSLGRLIRSRFTEIELVSADDEASDSLMLDEQASDDGNPDSLSPFRDDIESELANERPNDDQGFNGASKDRADRFGGETDEESSPGDDEAKRLASRSARVAELMKPISEIEIIAIAGGAAPDGYAENRLEDQPMIAIGSLGIPPIAPSREARCFTHRPLYYEQPNLERCGQSYGCCQNAVSAARFLCNTVLLPYHLGRTPCSCLVSAGRDCRTCETYPHSENRLTPDRWDTDACKPIRRGFVQQAAAVAGFIFLLL